MNARTIAVLATFIFAPFLLAGAPAVADTALLKVAAQQAAKGKGIVNSVDAAAHKVNMSHDPIPALGWPAMKMDFAVAPAVDLSTLQTGSQVEFTVGKNQAGLPEIQSISAAKK